MVYLKALEFLLSIALFQICFTLSRNHYTENIDSIFIRVTLLAKDSFSVPEDSICLLWSAA